MIEWVLFFFSPFDPICSNSDPMPESDYKGRFAWSSVTVTVTSEGIFVPTVVSGNWVIDDVPDEELIGVTGFDGNVTFTSDRIRLETARLIPDGFFRFNVISPESC